MLLIMVLFLLGLGLAAALDATVDTRDAADWRDPGTLDRDRLHPGRR